MHLCIAEFHEDSLAKKTCPPFHGCHDNAKAKALNQRLCHSFAQSLVPMITLIVKNPSSAVNL